MGPTGVQEWLVVDGQQRLTTLSIFLCALRDHLAESQPEQRDRVDDLFLINKYNSDLRYKVMPTQADRTAYEACVDGGTSVGHDDRIGAAYLWFRKALVRVTGAEDLVEVSRIERVVTERLAFVVISAQPADNVHRIFESLNNTGVRLTQGDLLRNYFFMRLPTRAEVLYSSVWLPMQGLLNAEDLELLLWLDLVLRGDPRAKRKDLYRAQQSRLDKLDGEAALEAELVELGRRAQHLSVILNPTQEPDKAIRSGLSRLLAWGSQTTFPLLMHLLDLRARHELDEHAVAETVAHLESFLVRRMIVGRATNNLNRILTGIVAEMPTGLPVPDAVRTYLSGSRRYWAPDELIEDAVQHINFYWTGRATQRSLILRWLEESYGRKEVIDLEPLTIEHVLPQTLTPAWSAMLADDLPEGADSAELHALLLHRLGNLTLTGYNAELSNRPFDEKRSLLRQSGLKMNQDIAANERWGQKEIEARAASLAARIIRRWPGPLEGVVDSEDPPAWVLMDRILAALPPATWTSYKDLAEVIGSHPVPVGMRIASTVTPNGHRVLTSHGAISEQFRWYEPGRDDDPAAVLAAEGIHFDSGGHAHPAQRLLGADLADLAGLDREPDLPLSRPRREAERAEHFAEQLQTQAVGVRDAVDELLTAWVNLGGGISHGRAAETSAQLYFSPYGGRGEKLWTATVYPLSGTVEITFQHLKLRDPFTDPAVREEFRQRLNSAEGVDIPPGKIDLRPNIKLDLLEAPTTRSGLLDAFEWFIVRAEQDVPHRSISTAMSETIP
jgi:alkylated DNA nucleotide flippase Atl1